MARRFEYDRMTAVEFRERLEGLRMSWMTFARLFGHSPVKTELWHLGKEDIPIGVHVTLALMERCPDGKRVANEAAAEILREDNAAPELGPYPYRGRLFGDDHG